jgi:hypothetical protein
VLALAVWLASVGTADLVADLSGHPAGRSRIVAGWIVGTAVSAAGAAAVDYPIGSIALLTLITAVSLGAWLWIRSAADWSRGRAIVGFWIGTASVVGMVATSGVWPAAAGGLFARWLESLPFEVLFGAGSERVALILGSIVWLGASGNAVVRLALASIERDVVPGEEPLKGGRIIGPMERWLIFGLAVAGAPTAAGIVVAAKGLIRFAEIRGDGAATPGTGGVATVQWKTEYLLLGSLTSWLLALLPAALLA